MSILVILQRSIKWRFHHAFTILVTLLQPVLWLTLYGSIAGQSLKSAGIENYTSFILPGLMVLVSFSACSSSGMINYLTKLDGSFYRLLIAPVRRSALVLGQLLEGVLCTFLEVGILVVLSLLCSARMQINPAGILLILLLVFLTAFFMAGLSYALSLTLPDQILYETVMNAVVLPVFFLSSALFPADGLTGLPGLLVRANPFTHVIDALRSLILQGSVPASDLLFVLALFVVLGGLSFAWALQRLNLETQG